MINICKVLILVLFTFTTSLVLANDPDCSGVARWPTQMSLVQLKNSRLIDGDTLDLSRTKTLRLASQKIGKDLYRQIHHVKFTEKSGNIIEVITVSDASYEECSMGSVEVFVISQHLSSKPSM